MLCRFEFKINGRIVFCMRWIVVYAWYDFFLCKFSKKVFQYRKNRVIGLLNIKLYIYLAFSKQKLIDEQYSEISISESKSVFSCLVFLYTIYIYAYNFDSTSHKMYHWRRFIRKIHLIQIFFEFQKSNFKHSYLLHLYE